MFALFLGQNKSTSEQYAAALRQSVHPFWPVNSPIDPKMENTNQSRPGIAKNDLQKKQYTKQTAKYTTTIHQPTSQATINGPTLPPPTN